MSGCVQTRRIVEDAQRAALAADAIALQGCEIESVRVGGARPIIYVRETAATKGLRGAMYMRECVGGRVVSTYVTNLLDCQIRWRASRAPIEKNGTGVVRGVSS